MKGHSTALMEDEYSPPVYDEAVGTIRMSDTTRSVGARRGGVSRGATGGDEYQMLGNEDHNEMGSERERRANDIALARQRQHADTFQRQMVAEEDYHRSSSKQQSSDAEFAARLAAGGDDSAQLKAFENAHSDAELAAQLQREFDGSTPQQPYRSEKQKIVRVLVPPNAKTGDSLAVATPTAGKFAVQVPAWATPGSHFDVLVTTTVEIRPPPHLAARAPAPHAHAPPRASHYTPPPPPNLPPLGAGWERGVNDQGVEFFVDHTSRTTHWTHPGLAQTTMNPVHQHPPPPPVATLPPDVAPADMTEEEMLMEAIARSLLDEPAAPPAAQPEAFQPEAFQPEVSAPPEPEPPAPLEPPAPDLLPGYDDLEPEPAQPPANNTPLALI